MSQRTTTKTCLTLLLLCGLCLLRIGNVIAAPAVELGPDFQQLDLTGHLDILDSKASDGDALDDSKAASNPEAVKAEFRPLAPGDMTNSSRARWIRFGINNPDDNEHTVILQIQPVTNPPAGLHVQTGSALKLRALQPSGMRRNSGLYELRAPAHASGLVYLLVGGDPLVASSIKLASIDHYMDTINQFGWIRGFGQGLLLMLLVIVALAAAFTRDGIYLWLLGVALLYFLSSSILIFGESTRYLFAPSNISRWIAPTWLFASATISQLALRFPAWPQKSRWWPLLLHTISGVAALTALLFMIFPQWISLNFLLALALLTLLITTHGALLAYFATQDHLLLGFALARIAMFVALALFMAAPHESDNLSYSQFGLLLANSALELLMLLLLLVLRTYKHLQTSAMQQRDIAVAEAESRVRTELTAATAHRIRTPVSGVLGMIEMLQDANLSPAQRDQLDTMQRAGSELLNAVSELSDISRLEPSADPLQRGSFDMQALIVESVEGFRGLASSRALELIADFAPDLPRYVSGDQTRVRQLLLQLLHYAIARYRNGEILLRVDGKHRDIQFVLSVRGNEDQHDVSGSSQTDPALRLAIARHLTSALSGAINITGNVPGIWRTGFTLPLPAIDRQHLASEIDQNLRHRRLLIIDDSATFREVIERRAQHWGMHVFAAGTLSEGLARLHNQQTIGEPIDALLLDAEIPDLVDSESHTRLQAAGLPRAIILLATVAEAEHSALARTLAVRRVLLKPVDHTSLQLALAEELSEAPPRNRGALHRIKPPHCLIAEDNPINAQVLQGLLTKLGATYTTAVNGQAAVEAFQREPFDLVLMDCDMPVMDGFEAAHRIREIQHNRRDAATPIIALTANTLEELGERARTGVMDAHLVKPVRLQSLRQLLTHWCGLAPEATHTEI